MDENFERKYIQVRAELLAQKRALGEYLEESSAILTRNNDKKRRGATAHVNMTNTTNTPSGPSAGEVNLSIVLHFHSFGLLVFWSFGLLVFFFPIYYYQ